MNDKFYKERKESVSSYKFKNELSSSAKLFFEESFKEKYSYNFDWLGRPIIQYPQDMIAMQEIIWTVKPDLIVETGIARGGSLVFNASILMMLDYMDALNNGELMDPRSPKRKVLGVDIDIRSHNRKAIEQHVFSNRIDMIQGSSIDKNIIQQVCDYASTFSNILVCLDSNHTHEHVLAELNAYAHLVSLGSYCIVYDTMIEDMSEQLFSDRPWGPGDNPKTAIRQFLQSHKNKDAFEVDEEVENKLLITVAPGGYLKRIK